MEACPTCPQKLDEFYEIHNNVKLRNRKKPEPELLANYHKDLALEFADTSYKKSLFTILIKTIQSIYWSRSLRFRIAEVVGLILIGVKDHKPDGLIFKQEYEERITNICRDRLNPPQSVNFDISQLNENTVLIVEIVPSREPVQADGKYFIRVGSTTREMKHEEIKKTGKKIVKKGGVGK